MNQTCPPEHMLVDGVRNGTLTDEMRDHLDHCDHCRELAWTTRMMKEAASSISVPDLPEADVLYGRVARPIRPQAAVLLPIWVMHVVAGITAILLTLAGLVTGREAIPRLLGQLGDTLGISTVSGGTKIMMGMVGTVSLILVAVIPILVSIFWFRDIWRERRLIH